MAKLGFCVNLIENAKLAQTLRTIIGRKMTAQEPNSVDMPSDCPKPILPKQLIKAGPGKDQNRGNIHWTSIGGRNDISAKLKLADIDPLEAARQLTLIEFDLFSKIKVYF
jgi:hypothetical protein